MQAPVEEPVALETPLVDEETPINPIEEPAKPVQNEPRWLNDMAALWRREIRAFFSTAAALIVSPQRFGREWASGQRTAMNPIAFVLASATVLLPIDYRTQKWLAWDKRPDVSFATDIARAFRPFAFAIAFGLVAHVLLRLLGSRRHMPTTVGLCIYTAVVSWAGWCLGLIACAITGAGGIVPNICSLVTLAWPALALAGAHAMRWWWCALIIVVTAYPTILLVNLVFDRLGLS
jgi:hypothetical protein